CTIQTTTTPSSWYPKPLRGIACSPKTSSRNHAAGLAEAFLEGGAPATPEREVLAGFSPLRHLPLQASPELRPPAIPTSSSAAKRQDASHPPPVGLPDRKNWMSFDSASSFVGNRLIVRALLVVGIERRRLHLARREDRVNARQDEKRGQR